MKARVGFLGWLLRGLAIAYPVALFLTWMALRFVGERWWPLAVVLYLPRLGFALPLPMIVLALLVFGPRRLLLAQVVATALLLFPLMGLNLGGDRAATPGRTRIRVLSYNVDSARRGEQTILGQLQRSGADLLLLQESAGIDAAMLEAGLPGYHFHASGQFWTASRFPIVEIVLPPKVVVNGKARSPRFIRYRLATPRGDLVVYSIHPISPREGLDEIRGDGLLHEFRKHRLFDPRGPGLVMANTELREAQLRAIVGGATAASPAPVIIAGDTNLPGLSWFLARWFDGFRDGFSDVGRGFGYTFPAPRHPWMRIDRVFAGPGVRFLTFTVDRTPGSDHRAVVADLELP